VVRRLDRPTQTFVDVRLKVCTRNQVEIRGGRHILLSGMFTIYGFLSIFNESAPSSMCYPLTWISEFLSCSNFNLRIWIRNLHHAQDSPNNSNVTVLPMIEHYQTASQATNQSLQTPRSRLVSAPGRKGRSNDVQDEVTTCTYHSRHA
jgi:hypothetical protein